MAASFPETDRPAPPRRRMRRGDRERQLLETAERAFAERGYNTVTMEEIAHRAGVTRTVLYQHFSSKEALAGACAANAREHLAGIAASAFATLDEAESLENALWQALRRGLAFVEGHARLWSALRADGALAGTPAGEEVEATRRQQGELIAGLVSAVVPDLTPARARLYAEAIIGACERVALWRETESQLDTDEIAAGLMDIAWLGLDSLSRGARWRPAAPQPGLG